MRAAGLVIDSRRYASSTCTTAPSFMVSVLPNSPLHVGPTPGLPSIDRKSTRLNSSHIPISYAVFCLKKKKMNNAVLQNTRGVDDAVDRPELFPDPGKRWLVFFFNDTATTEIYTLSLHDALPI